ncbi:MAG: translocation/assembly module TamB domain-containing protein [Bacteroidota bacterium]
MKERPEERLENFFQRLKRRRLIKVLFRYLKWLAFTVFLLIIILWVVLQNKDFQNWAVDKTTTYLSEELQTRVELERIDLELFSKLVLENFYVEDLQGDTLLYSKKLKTTLSADLLGILTGRLDIDDIHLDEGKFYLRRDSGQHKNNLNLLLAKLKNPSAPKKKKKSSSSRPFFLDIDALHLNNVRFEQDDRVKGQRISAEIRSGNIQIDSLDLEHKRFVIRSAVIERPIVSIEELEKMPLLEQVDTSEVATTEPEEEEASLSIHLGSLRLSEGDFSLDNFRKAPTRTKPPTAIDFQHLDISGIDISIDDFDYQKDRYSGTINNISLSEESGFVLEKLAANQALVTNRLIQLEGMQLITPNSRIQDTLEFKFRSFDDFGDFEDKIRMKGDFKNSRIALKDIFAFAPKLGENAFFKQNEEAIFEVDGLITGKVNNLKGNRLALNLGNRLRLRGNFNSRNLAVRNDEMLNLRLERLQTDMATLRLLIPDFSPPANFDKLGKLDFSGRFDGFFTDFVAYGALTTDLGKAEMDMRMDLREGRVAANYNGRLSLTDFDLKSWSGNQDVGNITFVSEVREGRGLTIETVNAKLNGQIASFTFKDYTYENVTLDGVLNQDLFDGELNIKDDNIDFSFDGSIDYSDSIPAFNFIANVNKADLYALNLVKKPLTLAGDVDFSLKGRGLSSLQGRASVYDLNLVRFDTQLYQVDTIELSSIFDEQQRVFTLHSEVLELSLRGLFDIERVPEAVLQYFETNFKAVADRFNIHSKGKDIGPHQFHYQLSLHDSKNLTTLFAEQLDTIRNLELKGFVDLISDSINLDLGLPRIKFGNVIMDDIVFLINGKADSSDIELGIYHTSINNKQHFEPLTLVGHWDKEQFDFEVNATNFTDVLDNFNLNGQFTFIDEYFQIKFLPSNLVILKENWDIDEDNYIRFGKNYIQTQNFSLSQAMRNIEVTSSSENGLTFDISGFDLSLIDELWRYDKLDFSGPFEMSIDIDNIFKMEDMRLMVEADTFRVNEDDWGHFRLDANMPSLSELVRGNMSITRGDEQLTAEGYFAPPAARKNQSSYRVFKIDANIVNYSMHIAEYWIGGGVTNTTGRFDAQVDIWSAGDGPELDGEIYVRDLAVTINYLKTRYFAKSGIMKVNNRYLFDASGNTITDKYGNTAQLEGGITHNKLRNLSLEATVTSDRFLVLDTKKEDNDIYYGHCLGGGTITFGGTFQKTDLSIDAVTGEDTRLIIPITEEKNAGEISFIKLINKDDLKKEDKDKKPSELRGFEVDINLTFNELAEVLLVFDERAGDIIKGQGRGAVQMFISRSGNISMFGDYEIETGEYLFTLYNFINKPFIVNQGGNIRWTGDPYNATIDFVAEYKGLKTSMFNLLVEYLNTDELRAEARNSTDVDLKMSLNGQLLQPNISFDIGFPSIDGQIKSFTDSKMRIVRRDPNELNRQVFGLLVIGSFLPSGQSPLAGTQGIIGINTLSEMVTNQLSIYLTELLAEVFTDVGFISGVDFDINYNIYQSQDLTISGDNITTGNEIALDFKTDLFDDRLSLNFGGNIDWGSASTPGQSGAFLAGEFVLEYVLTRDRRFKVRFYQLSDQTIISGRRNKTGLGLSFRREFDSFGEFIRGMKKTAKKIIDD